MRRATFSVFFFLGISAILGVVPVVYAGGGVLNYLPEPFPFCKRVPSSFSGLRFSGLLIADARDDLGAIDFTLVATSAGETQVFQIRVPLFGVCDRSCASRLLVSLGPGSIRQILLWDNTDQRPPKCFESRVQRQKFLTTGAVVLTEIDSIVGGVSDDEGRHPLFPAFRIARVRGVVVPKRDLAR